MSIKIICRYCNKEFNNIEELKKYKQKDPYYKLYETKCPECGCRSFFILTST